MNTSRLLLSAFVLTLMTAPLSAQPRKPAPTCLPQIEQGWIRLLPGGMPMHAGFGRISNACAKPADIVSASSDAYASVELHETTRVDGVSRMRQIHRLPLAAKGSALLQPGGLHLMLMQPKTPLQPGERVRIVFKLADGRELRGEFTARAPD